jgi:hypothetical protein
MKRPSALAILITVFVLVLVVLLIKSLATDTTVPRFVSSSVNVIPPNYSSVHYDFLSASPFEGGKMWVSVASTNKFKTFLLDVDRPAILGELVNASPVFFNRDRTRLLCSQRTSTKSNSVWAQLKQLLERILNRPSHISQDRETFWVVDLKHNSVSRLGQECEWSGAGSIFQPSPGFRYGFDKPTASFNSPEILICDIENKIFRKERVDGFPIGWWDARHILLKDTNDDLVLYDVEARTIAAFLTLRELQKSFVELAVSNNAGQANAFFICDGPQNDFYLTEGNKRWSAEESYLIKIERAGRLKLLDPHFKFEWSDHFDATGNYYLYSGRERGETNSAVYVRDIRANKTRELVPPDPNRTNDFSLPNFYGTDVIYVRSNGIWRISLDGSQNRRIFPP